MVCSGDAGIYGMAGLLYEMGQGYPEVELEVVAGDHGGKWRCGSSWCTSDA